MSNKSVHRIPARSSLKRKAPVKVAAKPPDKRGGYRGPRDDQGIAKPTTPRQLLDWRKAEMAGLELEKIRGTLVERVAVERSNRATAQMIQTDILGLGRRLAPLLVGRDIVAIQEAIDKAARELINTWRKFPDGSFK